MTPHAYFWKWFVKHEPELFEFDATREAEREAIFSEIAIELHKVDPDLTFEIGPNGTPKREFIISAGGIKRGFPAVVLAPWRFERSALIRGTFNSRCLIMERWLESICLFPGSGRMISTSSKLA